MAVKTISVGPITRIEGHLDVEVDVEDGVVTQAYTSGTLIRGFENVLTGRDPKEACYITQRVCGVCPIAHGYASCLCLDDAYGIEPPANGIYIRNIMQAANFVMSHATHHYALFAPDMPNPKYKELEGYDEVVKRFTPFTGTSHVAALRLRPKPHELIAIFGGKMPHVASLVPGGVTCNPTLSEIVTAESIYMDIKEGIESVVLGCSLDRWLENTSLNDVVNWLEEDKAHANSDLGIYITFGQEMGLHTYGEGCGNFLAYGALPNPDGTSYFEGGVIINGKKRKFDHRKITENISHSWYTGYEGGKHPWEGMTKPEWSEDGKYSYIKSYRYDDKPVEAGPLARLLINEDPLITDVVKHLGVNVFTRHLARLHETALMMQKLYEYLEALDPSKPCYTPHIERENAEGVGLNEAPRGAVGHWVRIKDGKIANYQIIAPTTVNAGTRDENNVMGPMEQAITGAPASEEYNMVEVQHVVRSFDPCLACSVQVMDERGVSKILEL
ncbi:MAG: nickel-dependent hydrogenase large subunit [Methermicoccaceae archaeon]